MDKQLIIDVGMNTGIDTEFYLQKGFRVIAIEANPRLAEEVRGRLKDFVSSKQLVICNIAIAEAPGEIDFYVNNQNSGWSTINKAFAERNERFGSTNTLTRVKCTTFQQILREHGVPYYLKIDIEGADILCLESLRDFPTRPKFISIEAGLTAFDETFTELALMWLLGYRDFKIINQALNPQIKCPNPPLEGKFIDFRFHGDCTGPFGEETTGPWLTVDAAFTRYRRLLWEQKYFGADGKLYKTFFHKLYELVKRSPAGWYDFHARHPNPTPV
jgi:FkbM family methyltransferase